MQLIDQLSDPQAKTYAKHCFEDKNAEELRAATNETPDPDVLSHWGLTEGQYSVAITTALAELES
ncbi:hypothetical protein KG088_06585 [Halomonas sp. TRM85114]|uniref:hypothetical protein n=1 Tax=Halomonas jincaotanensis TaxID=2810616 RepID=UPI001BD37839|nr:hypothetical protein [Halomonas jincaotanensis]MBS9403291.1 hypothetical protein [Halomonas jincaotanensis]